MDTSDLRNPYSQLTGHLPFPWQEALYERLPRMVIRGLIEARWNVICPVDVPRPETRPFVFPVLNLIGGRLPDFFLEFLLN